LPKAELREKSLEAFIFQLFPLILGGRLLSRMQENMMHGILKNGMPILVGIAFSQVSHWFFLEGLALFM
jgi:hypothetical protein